MRAPVRSFVEAAAAGLGPRSRVLEVGAYRVAGQEASADLRGLFPGARYLGLDQRVGPGVDVVGNVAALPFEDASQDVVLCLETLEHVFDLPQGLQELRRVLAPGGWLVASTPFHFHIHAHPDDYWRITPSAWARLLAPYAAFRVGAVGDPSRPHTVLAIAVTPPAPPAVDALLERVTAATDAALACLEAARPLAERLAWGLKGWARSKGERRARAHEHKVAWRGPQA